MFVGSLVKTNHYSQFLFLLSVLIIYMNSFIVWAEEYECSTASVFQKTTCTSDAENGNSYAQIALGELLLNNHEYKDALKWFRQSVSQDNASAQFYMSIMFENGYAVPQDIGKSYIWLMKSATNGDSYAQYIIANKLSEGVKFPRDYEQAFKWYLKAAEQNTQARLIVANYYEIGKGVKQDYALAIKWHILNGSINWDEIVSPTYSGHLSDKTSSEQKRKGLLLANQWNKEHPSKEATSNRGSWLIYALLDLGSIYALPVLFFILLIIIIILTRKLLLITRL